MRRMHRALNEGRSKMICQYLTCFLLGKWLWYFPRMLQLGTKFAPKKLRMCLSFSLYCRCNRCLCSANRHGEEAGRCCAMGVLQVWGAWHCRCLGESWAKKSAISCWACSPLIEGRQGVRRYPHCLACLRNCKKIWFGKNAHPIYFPSCQNSLPRSQGEKKDKCLDQGNIWILDAPGSQWGWQCQVRGSTNCAVSVTVAWVTAAGCHTHGKAAAAVMDIDVSSVVLGQAWKISFLEEKNKSHSGFVLLHFMEKGVHKPGCIPGESSVFRHLAVGRAGAECCALWLHCCCSSSAAALPIVKLETSFFATIFWACFY